MSVFFSEFRVLKVTPRERNLTSLFFLAAVAAPLKIKSNSWKKFVHHFTFLLAPIHNDLSIVPTERNLFSVTPILDEM